MLPAVAATTAAGAAAVLEIFGIVFFDNELDGCKVVGCVKLFRRDSIDLATVAAVPFLLFEIGLSFTFKTRFSWFELFDLTNILISILI
jgi:hypothetical protein